MLSPEGTGLAGRFGAWGGDSGVQQEGLGTRAHASWMRNKPAQRGRAGLGEFRRHGDRRQRILAFRNVYYIRKPIQYARGPVTSYKNTHARTRDKLHPGRSPSARPGETAVTHHELGVRRLWLRAGPHLTPPNPPWPGPPLRGLSRLHSSRLCFLIKAPPRGPLTRGLRNLPSQSSGRGLGVPAARCRPARRRLSEGFPTCPACGPPGESTAPRHLAGPAPARTDRARLHSSGGLAGPGPGVGTGMLTWVCPQAPEPSAADLGQRGQRLCAWGSERTASASVAGPRPLNTAGTSQGSPDLRVRAAHSSPEKPGEGLPVAQTGNRGLESQPAGQVPRPEPVSLPPAWPCQSTPGPTLGSPLPLQV